MKKVILLLLVTGLVFSQSANRKSRITINDAWIRPAASGANSALFFEVVNNGDKTDSLLSAEFKHSEIVEIHETYKKSEDVMGMRAVKAVAIPAMVTVRFKPRDLHIMLIGLKRDVKIGQKYDVMLNFKRAGKIKINAVVRDMPKAREM